MYVPVKSVTITFKFKSDDANYITLFTAQFFENNGEYDVDSGIALCEFLSKNNFYIQDRRHFVEYCVSVRNPVSIQSPQADILQLAGFRVSEVTDAIAGLNDKLRGVIPKGTKTTLDEEDQTFVELLHDIGYDYTESPYVIRDDTWENKLASMMHADYTKRHRKRTPIGKDYRRRLGLLSPVRICTAKKPCFNCFYRRVAESDAERDAEREAESVAERVAKVEPKDNTGKCAKTNPDGMSSVFDLKNQTNPAIEAAKRFNAAVIFAIMRTKTTSSTPQNNSTVLVERLSLE